jgi:hypothetical protein
MEKLIKEHDKELLLLRLKQRLLAQGIRPQIVATAKIIKTTDTYILFGMWKFQGVLRLSKSFLLTCKDRNSC